jgi:transcriptional regulator with XRE-family HTH domain
MKSQRKNIRTYRENLEVKAMIVLAGREITELADEIGVSRNWLNRVVNGHEKGTETIELVKKALEKHPA